MDTIVFPGKTIVSLLTSCYHNGFPHAITAVQGCLQMTQVQDLGVAPEETLPGVQGDITWDDA